MNLGAGTGTFDLDVVIYLYTSNGLFKPTLDLIGNDGATTLVTSASPSDRSGQLDPADRYHQLQHGHQHRHRGVQRGCRGEAG